MTHPTPRPLPRLLMRPIDRLLARLIGWRCECGVCGTKLDATIKADGFYLDCPKCGHELSKLDADLQYALADLERVEVAR